MDFYRVRDRIKQWIRYPQPNWFQQKLLGLYTDSIDIDYTAKRLASESSARFVIENMRQARNFQCDYDLHEWAVSQTNAELLSRGMVLEFGVATGRTLNHFAKLIPGKTIHGFDGFSGLPENWNWNFSAGHFKRTMLPSVRKNCRLVVGWFDQTLNKFLKDKPQPVALLHIDCDLYSSTKYVLNELKDRIVPGTIIVFDEYLNFPGWEQDEHRAWSEFVQANNVKFEYLGFVSKHQQVVLRVVDK